MGAPKQAATSLPVLPESFLPVEHALYRPRHSARQRTARYAAVLFFLLPMAMLAVGMRPAEFENRELAHFPSPTDGWDFFPKLEKWAADHIPLRDKAVAVADGISRGVFGEAPKFDRPQGPVGPVVPPPKDPSLDRPEPTAFVTVVEGKGDWLFLGTDIKYACNPPVAPEDTYARIDRLRAAVESSGRKFVLAAAPNKSTMAPDFLPARYFGRDCLATGRDRFWQDIQGHDVLDLRAGLREAAERNNGTPAYSKYDSHWTHDGSVVLGRAVAEKVRPGTTRTWEVERTGEDDRPGDLAKLIGRQEVDSIPAYAVRPDGEREAPMPPPENDRDPRRFTQDRKDGVVDAKAAMVGDSFGYYSAPYVAAGFTELELRHVDMANKDPQGLARVLADSDVVVLVAAERNLVGGIYPMLKPSVIDVVAAELAARPRR